MGLYLFIRIHQPNWKCPCTPYFQEKNLNFSRLLEALEIGMNRFHAYFYFGGIMKRKLLIIDGHNLLFKMYYGIPSSIKKNGIEIKGVIGFIGAILKFYQSFQPYSILVVFDSEQSSFQKKQINKNYKENRIDYSKVKEEDNPFSQLVFIKECLNFLNIDNFESGEEEADDMIASICEKYKKEYQVIIVSTDKDFMQLVDQDIHLYQYNGKKSMLYQEEDVFLKYGILPNQFPLYLALTGDKSDNIKGIKGVGPKTAVKIILGHDPKNILITEKDTIQQNLQLIILKQELNLPFAFLSPVHIKRYKTMEIIEKIIK